MNDSKFVEPAGKSIMGLGVKKPKPSTAKSRKSRAAGRHEQLLELLGVLGDKMQKSERTQDKLREELALSSNAQLHLREALKQHEDVHRLLLQDIEESQKQILDVADDNKRLRDRIEEREIERKRLQKRLEYIEEITIENQENIRSKLMTLPPYASHMPHDYMALHGQTGVVEGQQSDAKKEAQKSTLIRGLMTGAAAAAIMIGTIIGAVWYGKTPAPTSQEVASLAQRDVVKSDKVSESMISGFSGLELETVDDMDVESGNMADKQSEEYIFGPRFSYTPEDAESTDSEFEGELALQPEKVQSETGETAALSGEAAAQNNEVVAAEPTQNEAPKVTSVEQKEDLGTSAIADTKQNVTVQPEIPTRDVVDTKSGRDKGPIKSVIARTPVTAQVASAAIPDKTVMPPVAPQGATKKPSGDALTTRERITPDNALNPLLKQVEDKAFEGVAEAQHDLAALYTAGRGVERNYERAVLWFREAAENGIANAYYNLGVLHHQGLGVPQNIDHALDWYRGAAQLGHPEAQYNLGIAYIEGIGVDYNPGIAASFFQQAAANGVIEAAYNLGLILENGLLGDARLSEALIWYRLAADQDNKESQNALNELAVRLGIPPEEAGKLADGVTLADAAKLNTVEGATLPKDTARRKGNAPSLANIEPAAGGHIPAGTRSMTAHIQQELIRLNLYSGRADGINGPKTRDAIMTFQSMKGLPVDGLVSEDLLAHITTNADATESKTRNN